MKVFVYFLLGTILFVACNNSINKETIKAEIFQSEKAFEAMTLEKGITEGFYYFADKNAVIKRENDTLIIGKEHIKAYYEAKDLSNTSVNWTPDFIEVSECGTMAYTYGNYCWKITNSDGIITEVKGVFHTVWKKQADGTWKYVWD